MIEIGSADFLIKVPSLLEKDFELYSSRLFDIWEVSVQRTLSIPDYSISLVVEDGSISGKARIAATAGAIYMGIANYGGFISGLQTISSQVLHVNGLLFESAKRPFNCTNSNTTFRNNGGAISRIHSLIRKVQKGTLTVDEAMLRAMKIFGEEGKNVPDFIDQLRGELERAPRYPEQLSLIEFEDYECDELVEATKEKPSRERKPKPVPITQQYRIEIWRDSKADKKHVKLSKK